MILIGRKKNFKMKKSKPILKIWNKNGPEDTLILKLIKNGKITKNTKPSDIQKEYPNMFKDFSLDVMRNHVNMLKRYGGVYRKYLLSIDKTFFLENLQFFLNFLLF